MPPNARFRSINGNLLKQCRLNYGWSQRELARRAGYSERLIRKAESSGSLSISTIRDLAEALSNAGKTISYHQLLIDYVSIATAFMDAYNSLGKQMIAECTQFLSPDLIMFCPADPNQVPFAGEWQGLAGLESYLHLFYSHFERSYHSGPPIFLAGDERVSARYDECFVYLGKTFPPIWVHRHFQFKDDLIVRIDDEFDTKMFSTYIREHDNASYT
ncbi:MAG: helix-turn-helix transcriptional regulator [Pirellulales bacterium]